MKVINEMRLCIESRSVNEGYARVAVSSFVCQLDPTVEEVNDIKTAVSEAVTNCIVHAYKSRLGKIYITVKLTDASAAQISIRDKGCGIKDVAQAMQPLYSTSGGERAGLGFSVMESFTDSLRVRSREGIGTTVTFVKKIRGRNGF